ncbi:TetR family transcriptional regulator [Rhodobacterales bacterium HKCCE2091]|nr:TetR family transcriptional regulator [Rhodobacterales bacterium HKCCE2091]
MNADGSTPWRSAEDRDAERQSKREAVLTTAVRFFNARGFHATNLDDVARRLKVTKPTIYHYFSSKEEILFECVRRGLAAIRDVAETAQAAGGRGADRLEALMREYALVMTRDFGMCVSRTPDAQLGPESRRKFRALKRDIHAILQGVIADGMADGSLRPGNPLLAANTVAGALNWVAIWYDPKGRMSPEDIADGMVATLMSGLKDTTP